MRVPLDAKRRRMVKNTLYSVEWLNNIRHRRTVGKHLPSVEQTLHRVHWSTKTFFGVKLLNNVSQRRMIKVHLTASNDWTNVTTTLKNVHRVDLQDGNSVECWVERKNVAHRQIIEKALNSAKRLKTRYAASNGWETGDVTSKWDCPWWSYQLFWTRTGDEMVEAVVEQSGMKMEYD